MKLQGQQNKVSIITAVHAPVFNSEINHAVFVGFFKYFNCIIFASYKTL